MSAKLGDAFPSILLITDHGDGGLFIRRTLSRVLNPLYIVRNAEEARRYLSGASSYYDRKKYPLPSLILMDLASPETSGLQLVRWIRQQAELTLVRVIVVSTNVSQPETALRQWADAFLIKPLHFDRLFGFTLCFDGWWLWQKEAPETSFERQQSQ